MLPAFIDALEGQSCLSKEHRRLLKYLKKELQWADEADTFLRDYVGSEEADVTSRYFDSEHTRTMIDETLSAALQEYAPPYFYFGVSPRDGSDFGFWLAEDFQQQLKDNDGIVVDDLSKVPKGFTGEVATVNDHGNVTLYRCVRGRLYEQWSLV
jgi:hypothetical protein